ncbi:MAG: hypothetical protein JNL61_15880 [Rhizobiaceae bacterium]|nr:hypothetical protein [Rhizobiaceae bacterium]
MPAESDAISPATLAAAVERGLISAEQARGLREMQAGTTVSVSAEDDDEKLRFITGFGDIFVAIGLFLFLGALGYFSAQAAGAGGTGVIVAAASWALAEYFTRIRRMALPSILLLLVFACAVYAAAFAMLGSGTSRYSLLVQMRLGIEEPLAMAGAGLITAAATALHYFRFRVPITIAAGTLALAGTVIGLLAAVFPDFVAAAFAPLLLICGLAIFALAMRFDMSDPLRQTRRADIAFWLHLVAAPLVVHSLVRGLLLGSHAVDAGTAWVILGVFVMLALVALLVDRRAILVAGLSYAGYALVTLAGTSGLFGTSAAVPLTMLVLGALVLLLSAGWHPLRSGLLGLLPPAIAQRLPPPHLRRLQS